MLARQVEEVHVQVAVKRSLVNQKLRVEAHHARSIRCAKLRHPSHVIWDGKRGLK